MNFNQLLGLNSFQKDVNGNELTHKEKQTKIINLLGYEEVKKCIPFTFDELKKAFATDKYFNNLPLKKWDNASGFVCSGANAKIIGSHLTDVLYKKVGVDCFSLSDGVCILKNCARMWVEEESK